MDMFWGRGLREGPLWTKGAHTCGGAVEGSLERQTADPHQTSYPFGDNSLLPMTDKVDEERGRGERERETERGGDVTIKVRSVKFVSKVPCVRARGFVRSAAGGQEDNEERQAVREKWR
ncbi:hypothetical protein E2C01_004165 [Portunus trituberculatus]|uniref:Uncharacterized protein n=1 Tax=Portunus trituberculatus TaxID=210409 RepID=A0A5B7CQW4_PORTR|nr:hypothetical protein [Portunus trituberculatus]